MIGVLANSSDHAAVREFFELFKTPWELYRDCREYDVVLCATHQPLSGYSAKLVLLYSGQELPSDAVDLVESVSRKSGRVLAYRGKRIPLYGNSLSFGVGEAAFLYDEESRQSATYRGRSRHGNVVRIGYDLFEEIRTLLTDGQAPANAAVPTLDLHIALLREIIVASGISFVEIPPIPAGFCSIACLTHDVDHPAIRLHSWDHTIFGFLYRAIFGSLTNFLRGRIPLRDLLANWAAAAKLPFVYLGLAGDFWSGFDDGYLKLEEGLFSTFFVIPFGNTPGKESHRMAPALRAARYGARDIADTIRKVMAAGCEVGLHGIDAWIDGPRGEEEFKEIRGLTGMAEIGVRMHWLYWDQASPGVLEQAGASYDSTVGYRETVGYRAGTTQAYKPLQAKRLLELPLHIMDTALFYPAYLGLSSQQAGRVLRQFTENLSELGGCITVNWHDRSLAPERQWYACYRELIDNLKAQGAWFATAGQAVSWFRKRRSVLFETDGADRKQLSAKVMHAYDDRSPGLRLRVHKASSDNEGSHSPSFIDIPFSGSAAAEIACEARR